MDSLYLWLQKFERKLEVENSEKDQRCTSIEKLLQPWKLPKVEEKVDDSTTEAEVDDESKEFAEVDALLRKAKLVMGGEKGGKRGTKPRPATAAEEKPKLKRKPPVPRQLEDVERRVEMEEVMADHRWDQELIRYDQLHARLSNDPLLLADHLHAEPACSEEEDFIDALFGRDDGEGDSPRRDVEVGWAVGSLGKMSELCAGVVGLMESARRDHHRQDDAKQLYRYELTCERALDVIERVQRSFQRTLASHLILPSPVSRDFDDHADSILSRAVSKPVVRYKDREQVAGLYERLNDVRSLVFVNRTARRLSPVIIDHLTRLARDPQAAVEFAQSFKHAYALLTRDDTSLPPALIIK